MNTLTIEIRVAQIVDVHITDETLTVDLSDGRTVSVPLGWYPRLVHSTPTERNHWGLIGRGEGIHFSDLDEDISVENIVAGIPSSESQRSFQRWLEERQKSKASDA